MERYIDFRAQWDVVALPYERVRTHLDPDYLLLPSREREGDTMSNNQRTKGGIAASAGRIAASLLAAALIAAVSVSAAVSLAGLVPSAYKIGPGTVEFTTSLRSPGETRFDVPPLGAYPAQTHKGPLGLQIRLVHVDFMALPQIARDPTPVLNQALIDRGIAVKSYIWRMGLLTLAGGIIGPLVLMRLGLALKRRYRAFQGFRYWRLATTSIGFSSVLIAGTGAVTYSSFDTSQLDAPRPDNATPLVREVLTRVPQIKRGLDEARRKVDVAATQLSRNWSSLQTGTPFDAPGVTRVLLTADNHDSVVGSWFRQALADSVKPSFVIDAGDAETFGTDLDAMVAGGQVVKGYPTVYVRGNHDTVAFQQQLDARSDVTVLDGTMAEIDGIKMYGLGDPTFTPAEPIGREGVRSSLLDAASAQADRNLHNMPPPDLVIVHNDAIAASLAGRVPLVVSGHYHHLRDTLVQGTRYLRTGSVGNGGADALTSREPYTATVLYFAPSQDGMRRLLGYDTVEYRPAVTGAEEVVFKRHSLDARAAVTGREVLVGSRP